MRDRLERQVGTTFRARTTLLLGAFGLASASAFTGCGGNDFGDEPGGVGSQASVSFPIQPPSPLVWLLVVDDDEGAIELRERVLQGLQSEAIWTVSHPEGLACAAVDPATSVPVDWSVIVVHPSANGEASFTSPADDARLRWREARATNAGAAAFIEAVKAALEVIPEAPSGFEPLAQLTSLDQLLGGQRAAAASHELDLLLALPTQRNVYELVAATRDDESSGEPVWPAEASWRTLLPPVVPYLGTVGTTRECRPGRDATTAKFSNWLTSGTNLGWYSWPCAGVVLEGAGLHVGSCAERCHPFTPVEDDAGSAECLLLAEIASTSSCDAEAGWLDPLDDDGVRRPRTTGSGNALRRVCEIQQLSGESLVKCRSDLTCDGCEPGWCLSDRAPLSGSCATGGRELPLRFIGPAKYAASGEATLICNVDR